MKKVTFEQLNKFMNFNGLNDEKMTAEKYLFVMTNLHHSIAVCSERKWGNEFSDIEEGEFFQIMPDDYDGGFFDWYCLNRPYHQFFITIDLAILYFLTFRNFWLQNNTNIG